MWVKKAKCVRVSRMKQCILRMPFSWPMLMDNNVTKIASRMI